MKKIVFLVFGFSLVLIFSCNKRSSQVISSKKETDNRYADTIVTVEIENYVEAEKIQEKPELTEPKYPQFYLLASLEKTGCYGSCPEFEFKIYSNGRAKYIGKKYVDQFGEFFSKVDEETLKRINAKATEINYFQLKKSYPINGNFIRDFPMTYTLYNDGKSQLIIMNNFDAPKALLEYESLLQQLIKDLKWERSSSP